MPADQSPVSLGPGVVGQRVVVRRVLPGQTGPTGGPAMTDVLGECLSWADGEVAVRRESGEVVRFPTADIVSGKPVPPRPSPRLRISAEQAARRATLGWPAHHEEPLGEWRLREAGGYTKRANSALATGDPGCALPEALATVADHYRARDLTPRVRVIDGSAAHDAALAAGWTPDPDDAASDLMLGSLSRAERLLGPGTGLARLGDLDEPWLATDERARSYGEAAVRVLTGGRPVFASVPRPDRPEDVVARGRAALCDDDWLAVSSLWTHPSDRRSGHGGEVMRALLEWGAERGATTVVLEVAEGNDAVREWYVALGLSVHHTYRYLVTT